MSIGICSQLPGSGTHVQTSSLTRITRYMQYYFTCQLTAPIRCVSYFVGRNVNQDRRGRNSLRARNWGKGLKHSIVFHGLENELGVE